MSGDGMTTPDESQTKVDRRHFLAGSLAGVVGSALVRLPAAGAQVDGEFQTMLLGVENEAEGTTGLTYKGPGPTLRIKNDSGPGIEVITDKAAPSFQGIGGGVIGSQQPFTATTPIAGVQGVGQVGVVGSILPDSATVSPTLEAGVWGTPTLAQAVPFTVTHKIGVAGTAFGGDQIGVVAHNPSGVALSVVGGTQFENVDSYPGIQMINREGPSILGVGGGVIATEQPVTMTTIAGVQGGGRDVGVLGRILPESLVYTATHTAITAGVWGSTPNSVPITITHPVGVAGTAIGGDQIGVVAHNPSGLALSVVGGISVTCGGTGLIAGGEREAEIVDDSINAGSVVLVTMTGDPGNKGSAIQHVDAGDGYARLSLTARVRVDTTFMYLCFDLV